MKGFKKGPNPGFTPPPETACLARSDQCFAPEIFILFPPSGSRHPCPMKPRRSALCVDLAALAAEGAPDWVQLLPAGPTVEGRNGRSWTMHSPEAVVAGSLADRGRLPLDGMHKLFSWISWIQRITSE